MKSDVFNLPAKILTSVENYQCPYFFLRPITNDDYFFCGIQDVVKVDELTIGFNFLKNYNRDFLFGDTSKIASQTHVFEFESIEKLELFDRAFRVFNPGHFNMSFYYRKVLNGPFAGSSFGELKTKTPNGYFFSDNSLTLSSINDLAHFMSIFEEVEKEKKFFLMFNRWIFSMSGENLPIEIRFVDLLSLLEMIYVQDRSTLLNSLNGHVCTSVLKKMEIDVVLFKEKFTSLYKNRNHIMHGRVWNEVSRDDIIWLAKFVHLSLLESVLPVIS